MRVTNKHNLPEVFDTFHRGDKYSKAGADISVTEFIAPPQIRLLRRKHDGEITHDIVDNFWSLLGRAVHHILEEGSPDGAVAEERFHANVLGWDLSGQVDQITFSAEGLILTDYKVTKAISVNYDKIDWETQLNSYAWLVWQNIGIVPIKLQVLAIFRDWDEFEKMRLLSAGKKYPTAPAQVMPVKLWTPDEQTEYIHKRIALHQQAERDYENGRPLPECTSSERWEREPWWRVEKPDAKRARRVFKTEAEAKKWYEENGLKEPYVINHTPGGSARCERDFCRVSKWCPQYARMNDDKPSADRGSEKVLGV